MKPLSGRGQHGHRAALARFGERGGRAALVFDLQNQEADMQQPRNTPSFPHHRLDAYRVALEMAGGAEAIAARLTGRHRRIADQLGRAGMAVPLLIAEGAHRRTAGQKRQRFTEARGECAEVAAACELARSLRLVDDNTAMSVEVLADRVCAMLTKLIARQRG